MIDVVFIIDDSGRYVLNMEGHACHNPDGGPDIVCASASMNAYTLAQMVANMRMLDELEAEPEISMEYGKAHVACKPKEEFTGVAETVFFTIQTGFKLLSDEYPANVRLTEFSTGLTC